MLTLIYYGDFGKAEEELLGAYIIETDFGFGIETRTFELENLSPTKTAVLDMFTNCKAGNGRGGR